jgi:hypothetical protein
MTNEAEVTTLYRAESGSGSGSTRGAVSSLSRLRGSGPSERPCASEAGEDASHPDVRLLAALGEQPRHRGAQFRDA